MAPVVIVWSLLRELWTAICTFTACYNASPVPPLLQLDNEMAVVSFTAFEFAALHGPATTCQSRQYINIPLSPRSNPIFHHPSESRRYISTVTLTLFPNFSQLSASQAFKVVPFSSSKHHVITSSSTWPPSCSTGSQCPPFSTKTTWEPLTR
jgi:hypothetical protein